MIDSCIDLFFFPTGHANDDDPIDENGTDEPVMEIDGNTLAIESSSGFVTFDCPEPHCVMQFRREDRLHTHILLGSHKILVPSFRLLDRAILMYQEGLQSDSHKQVPTLSCSTTTASSSTTIDERLAEGWALHRSRPRRPFTVNQRSYLVQKYDEGERSGAKWDANSVAEARKN